MRLRRTTAIGALLALALTGCVEPGQQHPADGYVIAGGGTTGVYYSYGQQLAAVLSRRLEPDFVGAESAGSVDNLLRIGSGEAMFGFAQSDAAADAVTGSGPFSAELPIVAVARLYDEYVHVVVRADSGIESVAELQGRVISLGAQNSGVHLVATRVMEGVGVELSQIEDRRLGLMASMDALKAGEIEGFFWVGGVPTPSLQSLSEELPIRLLSIDSEIVDRINARHAGMYRIADFPVAAYGRSDPASTMTVPNFLITSRSAPDALVRDVLEVLFSSRVELASVVPAAALLDRRQAIFTDPLELHPGAIAYYSAARG